MEDLVMCTGMSVLDVPIRGLASIDPESESNPAEFVGLNLGGDAVNEAVVLTKLGVNVQLYTAFTDDNAGKTIRMLLEEEGVNVSRSEFIPGKDSNISVPIVFADAERVFVAGRKEDPILAFKPDPSKIEGAKVVTLASLYSKPYDDVESAYRMAKAAKEQGSIVCADLTYQISRGNLDTYKDVWPYVDYFFPNDTEAQLLTGETDPERMADVLLSYGIKNAIVKIGKRGCLFKNAEECFIVPPHLVEPKDTTGAGDNFCAGFICGLIEGKDHRECCRYANATASICIQYDGASTGVKSREQLQEVLDNY
ncbi:MAG: carbohydrate kinase family protein [Atopobiaceae bacterium]|nr:carbohydrate kinase family protein [Atopobiaceae bacterium]